MRLLILGWETPFVFTYGGLGTFLEHLGRALDSIGVETWFLGCIPEGWERRRAELGYVRSVACCRVVDLGRRNVAEIARQILVHTYHAAKLLRPDAIIANDYHTAVAVVAANELEIPFIYYLHTASVSGAELMAVRLAEAVAANSKISMDAVETMLSITRFVHPPPQPPILRVIHPAAPQLFAGDEERELAEKLRRSLGTKYVVGCVTRNQPNKGWDLLLKAVRELRREGLDLGLVMGGRGIPRAEEPGIRLLGDLDEKTKIAIYLASDLVVYPSTYEPFGLVPLEAAYLGKPVAVSKRCGVLELLRSAPSFEPTVEGIASTIKRLLLEEDLEKIASAVAAEARSRTWYDVAKELLQLVKDAQAYMPRHRDENIV